MKSYYFIVRVFPEVEGGWSIQVPALEGCYSQGFSIDEVFANSREAILCTVQGDERLGIQSVDSLGQAITDQISEAQLQIVIENPSELFGKALAQAA